MKIEKDKEKFIANLNKTFDYFLIWIDKEEYELGKNLSFNNNHYFKFFLLVKTIIFALMCIFLILISINPNFWNLFILFAVIFMFLRIINGIFKDTLWIHYLSKKKITIYQKQLNLILNASYLPNIFENSEVYKIRLDILNHKIKYYNNIIKPISYYIKNFEIIGFLGIIFGIIKIFNLNLLLNNNHFNMVDFWWAIILISLFIIIYYLYPVKYIFDYYNKKHIIINQLKILLENLRVSQDKFGQYYSEELDKKYNNLKN